VLRSVLLSEPFLLLVVALFLDCGPVEPLVVAALLAWLLCVLVAVLGCIRRLWSLRQGREDHDVAECVLAGLSLDLVGEGSSGHRILWVSNFVVDVVLGMDWMTDETAFVCKMSSKGGIVEEHTIGILRGSRLWWCQC